MALFALAGSLSCACQYFFGAHQRSMVINWACTRAQVDGIKDSRQVQMALSAPLASLQCA